MYNVLGRRDASRETRSRVIPTPPQLFFSKNINFSLLVLQLKGTAFSPENQERWATRRSIRIFEFSLSSESLAWYWESRHGVSVFLFPTLLLKMSWLIDILFRSYSINLFSTLFKLISETTSVLYFTLRVPPQLQKNCIVIGQVIVPGASYADYAMVYLTVKFDNPGIQMQVNDENRSRLNCFIETQTQPRFQSGPR